MLVVLFFSVLRKHRLVVLGAPGRIVTDFFEHMVPMRACRGSSSLHTSRISFLTVVASSCILAMSPRIVATSIPQPCLGYGYTIGPRERTRCNVGGRSLRMMQVIRRLRHCLCGVVQANHALPAACVATPHCWRRAGAQSSSRG